ncbi:MAG: 2-hydroxyacyl-CoA dehydratase [Candidatus Rokubacteria bacterium]|nr:2-hydroxyacyl-CoA dehydratase [Candidatus Rokubacteria bacterium]
MSVEGTIERARALVDAPLDRALEPWRLANPEGKVVGWFPVYSPLELAHAGGILPVGVMGGGNQIEIAHADSRFQSFVCSIVKSTLELGLTGRLKALDGMVFHSICDPAKNLASVVRRNFPELWVEFVHFPQNLTSPLAEDYLVAEYRRILDRLTDLTGRRVGDEDLRRSLAAYNASRARIRRLYEIRRESPQLLSATESYLLVRAGILMPPEEHAALLDEALDGLSGRDVKPKDRIRVVIEGSFCEQPPLELLQSIEEAGCDILDDDLLLGVRWFLRDVPIDGDPLRALARSYIDGSVHSSVKHDLRRTKAQPLLDKARGGRAHAVVVLAAKFCEPALFDYALYRKALDEAGIPHVFLEFEEKMWIFDKVRTEVETFVESMLFD